MPWRESRRTSAGLLVVRLASNVLGQLRAMRGELGDAGSGLDFALLEQSAISLLCRIGEKIRARRIRPWWDGAPSTPSSDTLRLGAFPISANPLHWAHVLAGLFVMERYDLDRVLYVVAGTDPRKPGLAPENERHEMARSVLALFEPLLAYSDIARGTDRCGEESLFHIIAALHPRPVHAYYVAGSDHYYRRRPQSDEPDTIERLERGIAERLLGYDPTRCSLSAVFLERGETGPAVPTWLDVELVPGMPFETSSTAIREALANAGQRRALWTLPFEALRSIRHANLYEATLTHLAPRIAEPPRE